MFGSKKSVFSKRAPLGFIILCVLSSRTLPSMHELTDKLFGVQSVKFRGDDSQLPGPLSSRSVHLGQFTDKGY